MTLYSHQIRCADNSVPRMIGSLFTLKHFPGLLAEHNTKVRAPDFHQYFHYLDLQMLWSWINLFSQEHSRESMIRPSSTGQLTICKVTSTFPLDLPSPGISRSWVSETIFLSFSWAQKDVPLFLRFWIPLQHPNLLFFPWIWIKVICIIQTLKSNIQEENFVFRRLFFGTSHSASPLGQRNEKVFVTT